MVFIFEYGLYLPCENYSRPIPTLEKLLQRFLSVSYMIYGLENTLKQKADSLSFSSGSMIDQLGGPLVSQKPLSAAVPLLVNPGEIITVQSFSEECWEKSIMSLLQTCFALSPSPQSFPRPLPSLFCDLIQHIPFAIQIILISTFKNAFCGLPLPPLDCQQLEARSCLIEPWAYRTQHRKAQNAVVKTGDGGEEEKYQKPKRLQTADIYTIYLPIIILMGISVPAHEITWEVSSRMCDMA